MEHGNREVHIWAPVGPRRGRRDLVGHPHRHGPQRGSLAHVQPGPLRLRGSAAADSDLLNAIRLCHNKVGDGGRTCHCSGGAQHPSAASTCVTPPRLTQGAERRICHSEGGMGGRPFCRRCRSVAVAGRWRERPDVPRPAGPPRSNLIAHSLRSRRHAGRVPRARTDHGPMTPGRSRAQRQRRPHR